MLSKPPKLPPTLPPHLTDFCQNLHSDNTSTNPYITDPHNINNIRTDPHNNNVRTDPHNNNVRTNPYITDPHNNITEKHHIRNCKPGDWNCPRCGYFNFCRRIQCKQCFLIKTGSGSDITFIPGDSNTNDLPSFKSGDWYCAHCHFMNFSKRIKCFQCSNQKIIPTQVDCTKSNDLKMTVNQKPLGIEFNHRTNSPTKSQANPAADIRSVISSIKLEDKTAPSSPQTADVLSLQTILSKASKPISTRRCINPGDWVCTCDYVNFRKRTSCYQCDESRPDT